MWVLSEIFKGRQWYFVKHVVRFYRIINIKWLKIFISVFFLWEQQLFNNHIFQSAAAIDDVSSRCSFVWDFFLGVVAVVDSWGFFGCLRIFSYFFFWFVNVWNYYNQEEIWILNRRNCLLCLDKWSLFRKSKKNLYKNWCLLFHFPHTQKINNSVEN